MARKIGSKNKNEIKKEVKVEAVEKATELPEKLFDDVPVQETNVEGDKADTVKTVKVDEIVKVEAVLKVDKVKKTKPTFKIVKITSGVGETKNIGNYETTRVYNELEAEIIGDAKVSDAQKELRNMVLTLNKRDFNAILKGE